MNEPNKIARIDADEFSVAESEAVGSGSLYIHKFRKPFEYEGMKISELRIDFEQLTGGDGLDIENELMRAGKAVVAPAFSGEYLIRMAARASSPKVGADAFKLMSLSDYNKVRSAARSFLLKSEL